MRKGFGVICMLLGALMVLGAGWLLWQNHEEELRAGESAEIAAQDLAEQIVIAPSQLLQTAQTEGIAAVPSEEYVQEPEMELPDGNVYIGYLELPTLSLKLPVMKDWSYPKLRIAPCRYWGSAQNDNLVIMAHNYERHFGSISLLQIGDPVQFVDAGGNIYRYVVAKQELLEKTDVDVMVSGDWDLTLFSCTYGGRSRVTVRLNRVLAYE